MAGEQVGAVVRQANTARCLEYLRDRGFPSTIAEIATGTGLSRPTVDAVFAELDPSAPVVDDDRALASGAGRPARRFCLAERAGVVAGLDAGPHTLRLVLADVAGDVLLRREQEVTLDLSAAERQSVVTSFVADAVREVDHGPLRAVGVAVPGILNQQQELTHCLTLPMWVGQPLVSQLAQALGCPVVIDNDIKLAALAEHRLRSCVGALGAESLGAAQSSMVFWQIGHRISMAMVMAGHLWQGSHRIAGELGTLRGMRWTATSRRGQLRWQSGRTAKSVWAKARAGNSQAQQEILDFCAEVSPTMATIILTVDPDVVVIGGGLSRAGAELIDPLARAIGERYTLAGALPPVVSSLLIDDGATIGALGLAFADLSTAVIGHPGLVPPWRQWHPHSVQPKKQTHPTTASSQPLKETA